MIVSLFRFIFSSNHSSLLHFQDNGNTRFFGLNDALVTSVGQMATEVVASTSIMRFLSSYYCSIVFIYSHKTHRFCAVDVGQTDGWTAALLNVPTLVPEHNKLLKKLIQTALNIYLKNTWYVLKLSNAQHTSSTLAMIHSAKDKRKNLQQWCSSYTIQWLHQLRI